MQKEFSDKSEETRVQINQLLKSFENEIFIRKFCKHKVSFSPVFNKYFGVLF